MPLFIEQLPGISCLFLLVYFFERTRPAASMRPPCLIYLSTSTGVRTGCHYLISLYLVCCNIRVFYWCESCTRPISTNPGSFEAGEHGLTLGTCFVTCGLEVVTVAGLLRISRCVLGAAGPRGEGFVFFFKCTRPAASMRPPCLIYLSTSNIYE